MNKRKSIKQKIIEWTNEINSGRHDGWVTEHFKKKIKAIQKACTPR